jgi:rubrerythrin
MQVVRSMFGNDGGGTRYESLRASRRVLARMVPLVEFGLFAAGVGLFLNQVGDLVSDMQLTWGERRIVGVVALITLGGFGLGGWVAGRLLRTLGGLIDVVVDQAEAAARTADLIEWNMVPALERVAVALERRSAGPAEDGRALAVAGVRQAIADSRWEQAERLLEAFIEDYSTAPERPTLALALAEARQVTIEGLRARLNAAQEVNDPEQVIAHRDELTLHLRGDSLKELDRSVIAWLMALIQRRLRTGTVRTDVARLAEKVADSFGDTKEGASMRAALPTLRRSAGLCPKCGQPYTGIAEACPSCVSAAAARRRAALAQAPVTAHEPADAVRREATR